MYGLWHGVVCVLWYDAVRDPQLCVAAQLPANTSLTAHHPWLSLNILPTICPQSWSFFEITFHKSKTVQVCQVYHHFDHSIYFAYRIVFTDLASF